MIPESPRKRNGTMERVPSFRLGDPPEVCAQTWQDRSGGSFREFLKEESQLFQVLGDCYVEERLQC